MDQFNQGGNPAATPSGDKEKKKGIIKIVILVIILAALIAAVGYLGWNWWQMKQQFQKLTMPQGVQELQKKQTEETIAKVSKHIVLPQGEDPIIATVTDAAALKKESSFYELAQNNDIVIIYAKAKKAFLYDPEGDIILNVGPVITETTPTPTPTPSASESPPTSPTKTPKTS